MMGDRHRKLSKDTPDMMCLICGIGMLQRRLVGLSCSGSAVSCGLNR